MDQYWEEARQEDRSGKRNWQAAGHCASSAMAMAACVASEVDERPREDQEAPSEDSADDESEVAQSHAECLGDHKDCLQEAQEAGHEAGEECECRAEDVDPTLEHPAEAEDPPAPVDLDVEGLGPARDRDLVEGVHQMPSEAAAALEGQRADRLEGARPGALVDHFDSNWAQRLVRCGGS